MTKLILMIGISGSGKSTEAEKLKYHYNAIVLSADSIRKELYGDENIQGDGKEVFSLLNERIEIYISKGVNVIVDNTNTTTFARQSLINIGRKHDVQCIAHITLCDVETAMYHQRFRDRKVPYNIVKRQYKQLIKEEKTILRQFDRIICFGE